MALHKKSEFARYIGKPISYVSTNISRGNIILSGNYIDDSLEKNAAMVKKWRGKSGKTSSTKASKAPKVEKPKPPAPPSAPNVADPNPIDSDAYEIEKQTKLAELRRKESAAMLNELRAAKMRGESIPTDLVMNVFSMLGQQFQHTYKDSSNAIISEIAHRAKLPPELVGEFRALLIQAINKAHETAILQTEKILKNIIDDSLASMENEGDEEETD